jgi:hypothetical protein
MLFTLNVNSTISFKANKSSYVVHFECELHNLVQGEMTSDNYCHWLRQLANSLPDCDAIVQDCALVHQLIYNMDPIKFSVLKTLLPLLPKFPTFVEARELIITVETSWDADTKHATETALLPLGVHLRMQVLRHLLNHRWITPPTRTPPTTTNTTTVAEDVVAAMEVVVAAMVTTVGAMATTTHLSRQQLPLGVHHGVVVVGMHHGPVPHNPFFLALAHLRRPIKHTNHLPCRHQITNLCGILRVSTMHFRLHPFNNPTTRVTGIWIRVLPLT